MMGHNIHLEIIPNLYLLLLLSWSTDVYRKVEITVIIFSFSNMVPFHSLTCLNESPVI